MNIQPASQVWEYQNKRRPEVSQYSRQTKFLTIHRQGYDDFIAARSEVISNEMTSLPIQ